ncbi:Protein CBG25881 [Caenorhabditis briggsae]|uniref:Protein CBG25881 n=1 Tax=Caenorhabditis briggsae TaxID=6238 RepID=B6IHN6_CAEBR|nr:Protein CBG25881 [Caenorhabditis briggsae]CAR99392.1 Protein CBG25881 [Caenorhabditis briggsae]
MDTIKTVKVVVVGESGAGKTALLTSFLENHFETDPLTTIGIDFKHKIVQLNDGQSIRLQLWDTAGQERFRQLTPAYIRSSKVALLVLDLKRPPRLTNIIKETKDDYIETSAKTRKNIKELFSMVACRPFPEHKTSQIILLNEPRPSESETRRCCQSS